MRASEPGTGPVVGLIGAFERDNFGDILFLERTTRYLTEYGYAVRPLSPFEGVSELLTGGETTSLARANREDLCDALWVVGGEVGGVAVHAAYRMLDSHSKDRGFDQASRRRRRGLIRERSGLDLTDLAYLPRPSKHASLLSRPMIVNSAGLAGVGGLRETMLDEAVGALRDAQAVSVRDSNSSDLLERMGIPHATAPDLVHTLRLDHGHLARAPQRQTADSRRIALVQVNSATLRAVGVVPFARALCEVDRLKDYELRLFVAGLAPEHDSLSAYFELKLAIADLSPEMRVSISDARDALDKALEIATSSIVIATSLHAMIVAMSFDVPRVGLYLEKLQRYASTWADPMPTAVTIDGLSRAVVEAFERDGAVLADGYGERLAVQSDHNIRELMRRLETELGPDMDGPRSLARAANDRFVSRVAASPRRRLSSLARSVIRPLS